MPAPKTFTGCCCSPFNCPDSENVYGMLYNSYAVLNASHKGLVPNGWHLPLVTEMQNLGNRWPGKSACILKSTEGWRNQLDGISGGGYNSIHFNAKAGGYCTVDFKFPKADSMTGWWTQSPGELNYPDYQTYHFWYLLNKDDSMHWDPVRRHYGFYVRLIKNR